MNTVKFIVSAIVFILAVSCGESDMTPGYIAKQPKILALKITNPEIRNGDAFSLNLLVAGQSVDQNMTNEVEWILGADLNDTSNYSVALGRAPYNQTFTLDETIWDTIPQDSINELMGDRTWIDIPVMAKVVVNGTTLRGIKTLRMTEMPAGMNPVIRAVTAKYGTETITITRNENRILTLAGDSIPDNFALTANMQDMGEFNDKLIYQWSVSAARWGEGELYINSEKKDIEQLLGENATAAEYRESVVFSTQGEDGDDPVQFGEYDIFLVVRDKKIDSSGREEDRFGLDFFHFTFILSDH
ncbi:MAG: hypothetical protein KJ737_10060 [Proteobacteria bacterium]|nr:hypothetical protein [Pseudomonadota bacterium]